MIRQIRVAAIIIAAAMITLTSCRGSGDEIENITLIHDVESIAADGITQVKMTVMSGDRDVTEMATFQYSEGLFYVGEGYFTTTRVGAMKITASVGIATSNEVIINGVKPDVEWQSQFVRHICVMDFTATDCAFCPAGQNHMRNVNRQMEDEATKIHLMAFYKPNGINDGLSSNITKEIMDAYEIIDTPYYVIDMRDLGGIGSNDEKQAYRSCLMRSYNEYPAHCSLALRSQWESTQRTCKISTELLAERNDYYRLAVYVIEHGIVAEQNVDGTYKTYTHNHVVRTLLSQSFRGDSLGGVVAGDTASAEYTITLPNEWVAENCEVVALAIDGQGFINNAAVISAINGDFLHNYLGK